MGKILLSTPEVSKIYGFSTAWLERQRWLGVGPIFIRAGRSVRYRPEDIEKYLKENEVIPIAKA